MEVFTEDEELQKQTILNHKIEVEDKKYENEWGTCCGQLDKRCLIYGVQMSLVFLIMGFCIFKLNTALDCNESQTFLGLLTMLVGLVLPSPRISS